MYSPESKCLGLVSASCPKPEPPAFGRRLGRVFGIGHEVHFLCKPGYELMGPRTRVCLESRKWSGQQPMCRRKLTNTERRHWFSAGRFLRSCFLLRPERDQKLHGIPLSCSSALFLFTVSSLLVTDHNFCSRRLRPSISLHSLPGLHPLHLRCRFHHIGPGQQHLHRSKIIPSSHSSSTTLINL